jgi:hypothetical protein
VETVSFNRLNGVFELDVFNNGANLAIPGIYFFAIGF